MIDSKDVGGRSSSRGSSGREKEADREEAWQEQAQAVVWHQFTILKKSVIQAPTTAPAVLTQSAALTLFLQEKERETGEHHMSSSLSVTAARSDPDPLSSRLSRCLSPVTRGEGRGRRQ